MRIKIQVKCDYDCQADKWVRNKPQNLADFLGRPELISGLLNCCKGKDVIDAGCGEGYISRQIAPIAKSLTGFDFSEKMIEEAVFQEKERPLGIKYFAADIKNVSIVSNSMDVYYSSMVYHHLELWDLNVAYAETCRILRSGGLFYILISHPNILNMLKKPKKSLWLKKDISFNLQDCRGMHFPLILQTIDGNLQEAEYVHSTFNDHKIGISRTGLLEITEIENIAITDNFVKKYVLFDDRIGDCFAIIKGKKK